MNSIPTASVSLVSGAVRSEGKVQEKNQKLVAKLKSGTIGASEFVSLINASPKSAQSAFIDGVATGGEWADNLLTVLGLQEKPALVARIKAQRQARIKESAENLAIELAVYGQGIKNNEIEPEQFALLVVAVNQKGMAAPYLELTLKNRDFSKATYDALMKLGEKDLAGQLKQRVLDLNLTALRLQ